MVRNPAIYGFLLIALTACGAKNNPTAQSTILNQTCGGTTGVICNDGALKAGVWGNNQANFNVSEQGASLVLGCATASIPSKILVVQGEFQIDGTYQEGGGAMPVNGFPSYPAHFYGKVDGDTLALTYAVNRGTTNPPLETLTLTFGTTGQIMMCE